ncbi:MAG: hypothetical protein R6U54_03360 [Candidatus Omnitrophota bacterium]
MNKKATALILTIIVSVVLAILGISFLLVGINEKNLVERYKYSTKAFWIAEAGLAQAYQDITNNYSTCPAVESSWGGASNDSFGGGSYLVTVTLEGNLKLTSTGTYKTVSKEVSAELTCVPSPFENTLSVGGDLDLTALAAIIHVNGKTRYSGNYNESTFFGNADFEDLQQEPDTNKTTLEVPDYDNNGVSDEFNDYKLYSREATQDHAQGEIDFEGTDFYVDDKVVYKKVEAGDNVNIFPHQSLVGKEVIYIEGPENEGDVNIYLDGNWQDDEDLTVISTGQVHYIEPLQTSRESRLSVISWEGYKESSVFVGYHESVVFTHGDAEFEDLLDIGYFTGNIIANGDVSLLELFTLDYWDFSDRVINGDIPPGFSKFVGQILTDNLSDWQEN